MESGESIGSTLIMRHLIGKHRPEDGMAQMIVGSVPGEESIQVLNGMVDMLLGGDFRVVAVVEVLAVLFCAILSHRPSHATDEKQPRIPGANKSMS